jgi:predicted DNA-binding antitoxin AbrB/MazE fold protein
MSQIIQVTYQSGHLILREKLKDVREGQTLKIMVLEGDDKAGKKGQFLDFVDRYAFKLPDDYRFDRDALHAR